MNLSTQHLIIGATGKTGSRVMRQLQDLGYHPKGASRHPTSQQAGVYFEWQDPTTWAQALTGVDSVYVTYFPDLAVPQAPEDISRFCALAKIKGVKHITLLSGRGEPAAQTSENIVRQSGISWTIVRAAWFNQNFTEGLFKQFVDNGCIALPVSQVTEPFVDIDDIAQVVTASMTQEGHSEQLYEVTGPELLSFTDLAEHFSLGLNRQVTFQEITLAEFQTQLQSAGMEQDTVEAITYLFTEVLDGRNEFLCDGIQRALGREPKRFAQYVTDNSHFFKDLS